MSDPKGHTIQVVNGPAGPSLYLDDYRIAGPKPWGGGTVLHEFAFKDKDLIAAGVTPAATPAPLDPLVAALEAIDAKVQKYAEQEADCSAHKEWTLADRFRYLAMGNAEAVESIRAALRSKEANRD
jgi:hypothetical protein